MTTTPCHLIRLRDVIARMGRGRSTIYEDIAAGTMTPPVPIGARAKGWPDYEIDAIQAARIAGRTTDQIRTLVAEMVARRREMA